MGRRAVLRLGGGREKAASAVLHRKGVKMNNKSCHSENRLPLDQSLVLQV